MKPGPMGDAGGHECFHYSDAMTAAPREAGARGMRRLGPSAGDAIEVERAGGDRGFTPVDNEFQAAS